MSSVRNALLGTVLGVVASGMLLLPAEVAHGLCLTSSDCASGESCIAGFCVDTSTCQGEGQVCTSSSQCCGSRVCQLGSCRSLRSAGETCGPLAPCEDPLVCDIDGLELRCRHDPPLEGEACSIFVPCAGDLVCNGLLNCTQPRGIGEACNALVAPCAGGLACSDCLPDGIDQTVEGCATGRVCLPGLISFISGLPSEAECLDWYSDTRHQQILSDPPDKSFSGAVTYASGGQITKLSEAAIRAVGAAYGTDGRYGCYLTTCEGIELDLAVEAFSSVGNYQSYDTVDGESEVFVAEVGQIFNFSKSVVFAPGDFPIPGREAGFEVSLSTGPAGSPLPGSLGGYQCDTELRTVIGNGPPTARCADATVCADGQTCVASASVDAGSDDPDGDAITLDPQPPGPYGIGVHPVTLTAEDPFGETASCTAQVIVDDCTPPSIVCPAATTAECTGNAMATVDPGDATVTDCSSFVVDDPGAAPYPVGSTSVGYTATDAAGNASSCATTVTVVDTLAPVIDAVTATPNVLWPPHHKLATIEVAISASDVCDPTLDCAVVDVASSEPDAGLDDEDVPGDVEIVDADTVRVRQERGGEGPGRTYTITVECADDTGGNATQATTTVVVPHDQSE